MQSEYCECEVVYGYYAQGLKNGNLRAACTVCKGLVKQNDAYKENNRCKFEGVQVTEFTKEQKEKAKELILLSGEAGELVGYLKGLNPNSMQVHITYISKANNIADYLQKEIEKLCE
jgi:hypothetical protein